MSSHISKFIVGLAFLVLMVGTPATFAAKPTAAVCNGLSGNALGVCRAAVASGCADSNTGSKHCMKLAANFKKLSGDEPVWMVISPAPPAGGGLFGSGGTL